MSKSPFSYLWPCPVCFSDTGLASLPALDGDGVVALPKTGAAVTPCPHCDESSNEAPYTHPSEHWSALVLGVRKPVALPLVDHVVQFQIDRSRMALPSAGTPLIVLGSTQDLKRLMKLPGDSRVNLVRLDNLRNREWSAQIEGVKMLADVCLQCDEPASGYWMLQEAVGWFNELYFHPVVNRLLQATASLSGDQIAPDLKEPRTAGEDLDRMSKILEPLRIGAPPWQTHAYLGFFLDGPRYEGEPRSMTMNQVSQAPSGALDFDGGFEHLELVSAQAIAQDVPTLLEQSMLTMCVLGLAPTIRHLLERGDPKDQVFFETMRAVFHGQWDLVGSTGRYQLYKKYREVSGGRDLVMDFGLDPKGIYLTISRYESGGDPRF